ncbi:MAG: GGDEF domain-containing protein [Arcobacteraceae bacterium]|nr:GGDEF domain-containing protein [Arcobacteraceae bacterium]
MSSKNIFATMTGVMLVMFLAMIANITLNLREFGFSSAKIKAQLVAESVKNGLTAHMVNGMMQNRDFYINQTKNLKGVDDLWIIRSDVVTKQYGAGREDDIRDEIDKKVLSTGISIEAVNEKFLGHSTYRITIPYKAEQTKEINCLNCHNAKQGETLGIISMVMTVDDLKQISTEIIAMTSLIAFILMFGIIWWVKRLMNPYFDIFGLIKKVMKKANRGDYSGRIEGIKDGEAKEVAHWINEHMDKLQTSLISIEDKIEVFLTAHKTNGVVDPMIDVKNTVNRLADIYRFRKTIEKDEHIEEVYIRFATILEEKFGLENFHFLEADTTNKKVEIVYVHKELLCDPIKEGCRADRTNTLVDSCQFKKVCNKFQDEDNKKYICVPYSISNDLDFILSIVCETKEEQERIREILPFIQDYVDSAKPEIVSKKLMQILERSAQTDALTGLYNRKFLERYIDNTIYNAMKNIPCGIMMVDIDFFKLINDNYGHDIGDIAIKTISNTLMDVVDDKDIVIRFGGEEFIVVLIDCDEDRLQSTAEEIRIAFSRQKIQANSEIFSKTVSIGTALFPNQDKSFWKYVKQSDIALYKAKQTGRNKVVRYDETLETPTSH